MGDPVDHALNGQLGTLRLFHHPDDLRQHGIAADLLGAKRQRPGAVHSGPDHLDPFGFLHRDRFACDHAFVDIGRSGQDGSIHGNLFTGPDMNNVARGNVLDRALDNLATALDPCRFGLKPDQFAYGFAGAAFGACFK